MRSVSILAVLAVLLMLVVGCGIFGDKGISDNDAIRVLFIAEARKALAEEGVTMSEADLAVVYEAGVEIANSDAAATISEKVEGNEEAKKKLEALLDKYVPKE